MKRTEHLLTVTNLFGEGDATPRIRSLIEAALVAQDAVEQEERKARGRDVKTNPYVTDAGKCPRKVYLSLTGAEETHPLTLESRVNFAVGHATEEAFSTMLSGSTGALLREVRVELPTPTTTVSGRLDFLLVEEETRTLIELKSISSRSLGMMLKQGERGRGDHRKQLNLYLEASHQGLILVDDGSGEKCPAPPMDHGLLVYVAKDATLREPCIQAFRVDHDAMEAQKDLLQLSMIAAQATERVEVPVPDGYTAKKFPCSYCSYVGHCFS